MVYFGAGKPVETQQYDRMPHLERIELEQHPPGNRHADEQPHTELDDSPRIEPIGELARPEREHQKWQPVRNDRETAQSGRLKFPE